MNNITELISKPVISLFEGQNEGTVENILFDSKMKKAIFAVIFQDEEQSPLKILPLNKIYNINDVITIKNCGELELYSSLELLLSHLCNPINSNVYSVDGKHLGRVQDVFLNKNNNIDYITLNTGESIYKKEILSFNSQIMLTQVNDKKVRLSSFRSKFIMPQITQPQIVQIMEEVEHSPENKGIKNVVNKKNLIGKHVQKNILASNGEVLIRQHTKVTLSIVKLAKLNGVLNELTQNCL